MYELRIFGVICTITTVPQPRLGLPPERQWQLL